MKKHIAAILAVGFMGASTGCGLVGGDCKFAKGEIAANLNPQAQAFIAQVMEAKKIQLEWEGAIKAMAADLKVEPNEKAVLAKIQSTFESFRAAGQCTFTFTADVDLKASFDAAASGKAGSGGTSGKASASGDASVSVNVNVEPKCSGTVANKAELDALIATLRTNLPKLYGAAKKEIQWLIKIPELKAKGEAAIKAAATDLSLIGELKCALETLTGFQANLSVQVDFTASVSGSAKGGTK